MPQVSYGSSLAGGGVSMTASIVRTDDDVNGYDPTLIKGIAGTLSTRTDNDTGIVTVASHSITNSDFIDLYWDGGRRYGMDVTANSPTTVSIDIGSGDNLPSASTAVVIVKRQRVNVSIDGDAVSIIGFQLSVLSTAVTKGQITFYDAGDAEIAHFDLTSNQSQVYDIEGGATNSFTGNPITYAQATNGSSDNDGTLKLIVAQDSTP